MDFLDDDARPRFLFQSRAAATTSAAAAAAPPPNLHKLHAAGCFSAAAALLALAYACLSAAQTISSLLLWFALSLLLAPFAPSSATGGDIQVGRGDPLLDPEPSNDADKPKKRSSGRRNRSQPPPQPTMAVAEKSPPERPKDPSFIDLRASAMAMEAIEGESGDGEGGEKEWSEEDLDLLKRQIGKHPAGEPRRWEKVAEAFRGRHGLESVISTAKCLSERRLGGCGDSYQQFLKNRKPIDKRVEAIEGDGNGGEVGKENGGGSLNWSSSDDIALLNALKAFPKDVSMRWEKIAAAVPGKSKAACVKRVSELKRDFRSSKATEM